MEVERPAALYDFFSFTVCVSRTPLHGLLESGHAPSLIA